MADPNEKNDDLEENSKKKKKKEKKKKDPELDIEEEETGGNKAVLFFVTLLIIIIWLAIIAILIKTDVGGFGSSVLRPILKDVPVINKILPEEEVLSTEFEQYRYSSVDEAVDRIKELELLLDAANANDEEDAATIAELNDQVASLAHYKEEQAAFELTKEKFYEEVVFSDKSPDIKEYKAYYESIYPENAEVLYKQVCKQLETDKEIADYAATYSAMKPKEAAAIFNTMTDDLKLVAKILLAMDTDSRGKILGAMDADIAAKVTKIMEP